MAATIPKDAEEGHGKSNKFLGHIGEPEVADLFDPGPTLVEVEVECCTMTGNAQEESTTGTDSSCVCCLVCLKQIPSDKEKSDDGASEHCSEDEKVKLSVTLLEFCEILKSGASLPPKFRASRNMMAPLCEQCMEKVSKLQDLLRDLEKLQEALTTSRKMLQDLVVSSSSGEDPKLLKTETMKAVNSIRTMIKKDATTTTSKLETRNRRKGTKTKMLINATEDIKIERGTTKRKSKLSSFGRRVKTPRFLRTSTSDIDDDYDGAAVDEEFTEAKTEVKYDPNQPSIKIELSTGATGSTISSSNDVKVKQSNSSENEDGGLSDDGSESFADEILEEENVRKRKPSRKCREAKSNARLDPRRDNAKETFGVSQTKLLWLKDGKTIDKNYCQKKPVKRKNTENLANGRIKCEKCRKTFNNMKLKERHVQRAHDGHVTYECKKCKKEYTKMRDLIQHRKLEHPATKRFKLDKDGRKCHECEFCQLVFKNLGDLQIHRRRHTGERPFKCDDCNETFISKGRFAVHVEVSHPDKAPLKCEFCPRSFFRQYRLKDHLKSHTGERPYLCEICSESFSQPTYLKYHQTKHKELNLAEFKCPECDKRFASPVNLKYHRETQHQKKYRYHCDICGHGATHMSHLKLHMMSHTGERPHICPTCGKTFSRGGQLKIHVRSHTGDRPYPCNLCTKSFTSSSKLRRHKLTHESNKSKRRKAAGSSTETESKDEDMKVTSIKNSQNQTTKEINADDGKKENSGSVVKVEHIQQQDSLGSDQGVRQDNDTESHEVVTIEQQNGVTYQVIATNAGGDGPCQYLLLNGDFLT